MDIKDNFARIMNEGHGRGDHKLLEQTVAESFVLHCPDGSEKSREEARDTYSAMRNALSNFTLRCDPILVDGPLLSARTIMEGRFDKPFVMAPLGRAEPNNRAVRFETISIFRFDDRGRLVEEWAQSDNMTLMAQMGLLPPGMQR